MAGRLNDEPQEDGKRSRVPFRRNRGPRRRRTDVTREARDSEDYELDERRSESVAAKGDLSRQRTVVDKDPASLRRGVVIAMRGLYVDVDDGDRIWACTVRRILRTRLIAERGPVTVGDNVRFHTERPAEGVVSDGVVEAVEPRRGVLQRKVGKRIHTMVANVDQAVIVSSAAEPQPKPHLLDRYAVACHAGGITPIICMNKIDLDADGAAASLLTLYDELGYATVQAAATEGVGIDELRSILKDKATVVAGQSGVGKSSLLNAVQPGLGLRVAHVGKQTQKGRHTTTTATLIRLDFGGHVVDTPGVRAFDATLIPRHELEAHFIEFVPFVAGCKFPDCTHIHETGCQVLAALDRGDLHPQRYDSYFQMFHEAATQSGA
jgi:ribosome biogenesis GTPase